MADEDPNESLNPLPIALGVVGGIVVGSMLFAITGSPIWVAMGIVVGVVVGVVINTLVTNRP